MIDKKQSDRFYEHFLTMMDKHQERIRNNPERVFEELLERMNVPIVANEYKFTIAEKEKAKRLIKEAEAEYDDEIKARLKKEDEILVEYAKLIVAQNEMKLEYLESIDALQIRELKMMKEMLKDQNVKSLDQFVQTWPLNENEIIYEDHEFINLELLAKMLIRLDESAKGGFIEGMETTLDLLFTEKGEIEFFTSGTDESYEFDDYICRHHDEIKTYAYGGLKTPRKAKNVIHLVKEIARIANLEVEEISKFGGRINGKQIAPLKRKELAEHLRSKNIKISRTPKDERRACYIHVMLKKKEGKALNEIEESFYRTIGDRVILKRKELVNIRLIKYWAWKRGKILYDPLDKDSDVA